MAVITETSYWGFRLKLSQLEACKVAAAAQAAIVLAAAKIPQPYGSLVATQIYINQQWIKTKAENSGGKGILLKFSWVGILVGIKRLGTGLSRCPTA
jgi:hypothetical protein